MTNEHKTAAEMLRELREGMTGGEWGAPNWPKFSPETRPNDARGIAALVNSLEEIAALVEAIERSKHSLVFEYKHLDALTAKLREQLKGVGDD